MSSAGIEEERLRTLREYDLLDTLPEESFDGLVSVAADFLDAPLAFFSLVDSNRLWFKARVGSDAEEMNRECSFCGYAAENDQLLIVEDAQRDHRFEDSPIVRAEPHIRFYIGVPIHAQNGHVLGTLCVLDLKPREVTREQVRVLKTLAQAIETQLELRRLLVEQRKLFEERAILTDMIVHDASGIVATLRWTFKLLEQELGKESEALSQCQTAGDELLRLCESVLQTN